MEGLLQPTSILMGELTGGTVLSGCQNNGVVHGSYNSKIGFSSAQEENDGLVTRVGARGPNFGLSPTGAPTPLPSASAPKPVPGTCQFNIGSGGYLTGSPSPTPNPVSCPSSSSNSASNNAAWSQMATNQWYFIDYSYDHMQMVGLFISSWGTSAWAYGLPDGSAIGQGAGQGQLYNDTAAFINQWK